MSSSLGTTESMARRRRDEETAPQRRSTDERMAEVQEVLDQRASMQQFTFRATLAGLLVGTLVCFSNMYFGLQSKFLLKKQRMSWSRS